MDKQQALKELNELKKRADALEAIINAPEVHKSYNGVFLVDNVDEDNWYLSTSGNVTKSTVISRSDVQFGLSYTSRDVAEKLQEQMELHQLARVACAKSWGSSTGPNWGDDNQTKFVLRSTTNKDLTVDTARLLYYPFAFKTEDDAKSFLNTLNKVQQRLFIMGIEA